MVKSSRYGSGVAQRMGRGIALLFHDRGTRSGWVVSNTSRPHFTPGKDLVPISQEAGRSTGPVWTGRKSLGHWDSITDRPARSESLYRLSYRAHTKMCKGKGKFTAEQAMKAEREGERESYTLSITSPLDRSGWTTGRASCFIPWKETRYTLYKRLGGHQGMSGRWRKFCP